MSDKKPSVFPTQEQIEQANQTGDMISKQLNYENKVVNPGISESELKAIEEMNRMRDEAVRKRNEQIAKEMDERRRAKAENNNPYAQQPPSIINPPTPPSNNNNNNSGGSNNKSNFDDYINNISQPQFNQPYDLIPLPSEGKLYSSKKKAVKVAFLTTADENILTSPNLVESGKFLEILINRKLLEPELRYKDLLPGDRNAIMIWLRATGYGEMYPITVYGKNDEVFDTEFNLSELKTVKLTREPDSEGLFSFNLPVSKQPVKFKLLTVGEIDELTDLLEKNKDNPINEEHTMLLEKQLVDVNGNRDRDFIAEFVRNMRVGDAQALRDFMEGIECGVDLNITVRTPGGESITTFLPFTPKFFWPKFKL